MSKISNIIPVTFRGGTGGNFLAWFLNLANENNHMLMNLSSNGNAHSNPYAYLSNRNRIYINDSLKIEDLKRLHPFPEKIWHVGVHIKDIDFLSETFEKNIRITYEENDIPDIASVVIGKVYKDHRGLDDTYINVYRKTEEQHLISLCSYFSDTKLSNVCYVTWKNLLYDPTETLKQKLGIFLNIPMQNFSEENLQNWRKKTLECILSCQNNLE